MNSLAAFYYDGHSTRRHDVLVTRAGGVIRISGGGVDATVAIANLEFDARLGDLPRNISIRDGGQLEIADHIGFERLFSDLASRHLDAKIWRLEHRWGMALGALLLTLASIGLLIQYGLPWIAREVAMRISPESEQALGEQSLAALDGTMLSPSMVDGIRVNKLKERFSAMTANLNDGFRYRLEIRAAKGIGPNAFALPSGIIIITDDLITLAQNDDELAAVLAHEIGHVRQRHTLRHTIQNSVTTLIVASLTGDLMNASSWAAALPAFTLQAKYSRDFEREADRFAIEQMRNLGIPSGSLGAILHRMEENAAAKGKAGLPDWLSTHPPTKERAAAAEGP